MIDFTIAGTKLPIISAEDKIEHDVTGTFGSPELYTGYPLRELVSFGTLVHDGNVFVLAEKPNYDGGHYYMFRLADLNKLGGQPNSVTGTQTITKDNLKVIHDIACDSWKKTIIGYTNRNPFGVTIELTNNEVKEMFAAASSEQLEVLAEFLKVPDEIDLRNEFICGLPKYSDDIKPSMIAVRVLGDYRNKSFYLSPIFNWEIIKDNRGEFCLVPTLIKK
jgi:hypothetical protein